MEAAKELINKEFKSGKVTQASGMQWVWVIDFLGFSFRDQNPFAAVFVARVMAHYPEFMHCTVLVDAPKSMEDKLVKRLGERMVKWLLAEMAAVRQPGQEKRKYWLVPGPGEHDSRGDAKYVEDKELYVETPGDAWEKRQSVHPGAVVGG